MKHQIAHDLDFPVAKQVANRAFEAYQRKFAEYHPKLEWVTDREARIEFSVKGLKLAGSIGILPRALELQLDHPFVFLLLKNKPRGGLFRVVRAWFGKGQRR